MIMSIDVLEREAFAFQVCRERFCGTGKTGQK
jgi:hypothetical protein